MEKKRKNNGSPYSKKQYIIKKDTDFDDLLKVKESFEDPNLYFKKDKKMVIGNLNLNKNTPTKNQSRFKSMSLSDSFHKKSTKNNIKIKKHKLKSKSMTQEQLFTPEPNKPKFIPLIKSRPKTSLISSENNKNININKNTNGNSPTTQGLGPKMIGIHYQKKSLEEIINILQQSKYREKLNKTKGTNSLFPKEVRKEIRENYYEQEKLLNKKLLLKNKSDLFSKKLSNKLKRNEEDLLINKIEDYRLKRQLIDYIQNSKSIRYKFGENYWIADLRRPKKQDRIRFNYVKNENGNNLNDQIVDYVDKDVEFINCPDRLIKNKYATLIKNLSLKNYKGIKLPNMEKMNEIDIIRGKNLIIQEYLGLVGEKNKNKSERKFKLYFDPSEKKYKNVKDMICGENYDNYSLEHKNKSFYLNRNENKYNKKRGLYKSKSQIEKSKEIKNINKISYLKEAMKIFQKEKKRSSIRIVSAK